MTAGLLSQVSIVCLILSIWDSSLFIIPTVTNIIIHNPNKLIVIISINSQAQFWVQSTLDHVRLLRCPLHCGGDVLVSRKVQFLSQGIGLKVFKVLKVLKVSICRLKMNESMNVSWSFSRRCRLHPSYIPPKKNSRQRQFRRHEIPFSNRNFSICFVPCRRCNPQGLCLCDDGWMTGSRHGRWAHWAARGSAARGCFFEVSLPGRSGRTESGGLLSRRPWSKLTSTETSTETHNVHRNSFQLWFGHICPIRALFEIWTSLFGNVPNCLFTEVRLWRQCHLRRWWVVVSYLHRDHYYGSSAMSRSKALLGLVHHKAHDPFGCAMTSVDHKWIPVEFASEKTSPCNFIQCHS